MFEQIEEPSYLAKILKYAGQLIGVFPVTWLAASPLLLVVGGVDVKGEDYKAHFIDSGIMLCAGYLIGLGLARVWPGLTGTGVWVWLIPGTFFILHLQRELFYHSPYASVPFETFFSGPGGVGLAVYLVTFPAFATFGYSLGMMVSRRRLRAAMAAMAAMDSEGVSPVVEG